MHSPLISLNYYFSSIEHLLERLLVSLKKDQSKRRKGTIFGKILFSTKPINRHTTSDILPLSSKHLHAVFQTKKLDLNFNWILVSFRTVSRFYVRLGRFEREGREGWSDRKHMRTRRKKERKKKEKKKGEVSSNVVGLAASER